jgi:hypothetical protein
MKSVFALPAALFHHASLAARLKHDGTGMPTELPAAMLLSILYMALSLVNSHHADGITLDTIIKVGFIAQCYVLFLRNQLVGLIIFISVLCNVLAFGLTTFADFPKENLFLLLIAEYIMVTAAILNVLKRVTKTI